MTTPPRKLDSSFSWLVCVGATISNGLINTVIFTFGVFLPVFMKEFNQNREKTALMGSLILAIACFTSPVGGKLCHRYSCQRTHILGTLTCAASLFTSSWATGSITLYFTLSVLYGLGLNFSFMACFLVVSQYFHKRHSTAIGIVTAGTAGGFFIMGPIMQSLVDAIGWRNSYRVLSAGLFACSFISALFDPNVEKKEHAQNSFEQRQPQHNNPQHKKMLADCSVWKIPGFTIPVTALAVMSFSHYSPPIHLVRHCEEMGFTSQRSSYLFIGMGLGSFVFRIAAGKICESVRPIYVNQIGGLLSGIFTMLLSIKSSYPVLVILTLGYGVADGVFFTTLNVVILDSVKPNKRAFGYGLANMATSITIATGPMITGLVADHHSYREAFIMTGFVTIVGALLSFSLLFFKKHKQRKEYEAEKLVVHEMISVL